jgi:hypothetical protein
VSTRTTSGSVPTEPSAARSAPGANRFGPAPKLLATALIGFVLLVATTLALLAASGVSVLSEATPAEFAAAVGLVSGRGAIYLLAMCWGAAGVVLVARRLLLDGGAGRIPALGALVFSGFSVLAAACQVVLPWFAVGFSAGTFGDTSTYDLFYATSLATIWAAVVAAGCLAVAARAAGVRPGFMLVVAIVCAAYLVVDVTTRGGVPPFGIAFVWLALGIGLRASRVPS